MKVFEVITEFSMAGDKEIQTTVEYVTSDDDDLLLVAEHFTRHCLEYEKTLKSIREVITVSQHIDKEEE